MVGIVVPNFNGEKVIRDFLNSCTNSSYGNKVVYVVDNGSTDSSREILGQFPDVRVIRLTTNLGSTSMNLGILAALRDGASYVFMADNDIIFDRNCIKELVDVMERRPDIGIVAPLTFELRRHDTVESIVGIVDPSSVSVRMVGRGNRVSAVIPKLVIGDCVGASLVRRSVIEKIGLFDELYFSYGADVDFCLRAKSRGFKIACFLGARIWHGGATTTSQISGHRPFFMVRNSFILAMKFRWVKADVGSFLLRMVTKAVLVGFGEIYRQKSIESLLAPFFASFGYLDGISLLLKGKDGRSFDLMKLVSRVNLGTHFPSGSATLHESTIGTVTAGRFLGPKPSP